MTINTDSESMAEILTPEEQQAYELAHNLYNAEVKVQAAQFLGTIGLTEEVQADVVTTIGNGLNVITSIEDKRQLARSFADINRFLGNCSLRQTPELEDSIVTESLPQSNLPSTNGTYPEGRSELSNPPKTAGVKARFSFLSSLFPATSPEILLELSDEQLLMLGEKIGSTYVNLSINRLSVIAKQARAKQMQMLLAGQDYHQICQEVDSTKEAIRLGLTKMPKSIRSRVGQDELDQILHDVINGTESR